MTWPATPPFLRVPPFPGSRGQVLARPGGTSCNPAELVQALLQSRVGGTFWGRHPILPKSRGLVLAPANSGQLKQMLVMADRPVTAVIFKRDRSIPNGIACLSEDCDPWHIVDHAGEIWVDANKELALVGALAGRPVKLFGAGIFQGCETDPEKVAEKLVGQWEYSSPFDGSPWSAIDAIAQLGEWRRLIDANRQIAGVAGVAAWKRVTLDGLLWNGSHKVRHLRSVPDNVGRGSRVLVWKSRTSPKLLEALENRGVMLGEIEDGFIRSKGLGANCVPPLSAIVDFAGIYFDPSEPSGLEMILETNRPDSIDYERVALVRERLVEGAISKYGQRGGLVEHRANGRRCVLVTGQVEDDRSILSGGKGISNLELLERARAIEGDAWIIYKPHPDVEAGHRTGFVAKSQALQFADEIQPDAPITALIDAVDGLHVITSLAGFEALLRGKDVTTHGVPFYAGWGLTRDLAQIPQRRTRQVSLDELVAATLLLYPRYLDPVTRLPCSIETLIERMVNGQAEVTSLLVWLRTWQGRIKAHWKHISGDKS